MERINCTSQQKSLSNRWRVGRVWRCSDVRVSICYHGSCIGAMRAFVPMFCRIEDLLTRGSSDMRESRGMGEVDGSLFFASALSHTITIIPIAG